MSTLTYTPESLESCELQLLRCTQSIDALAEMERVGAESADTDKMARAILAGQLSVSNESLNDLKLRAFRLAMDLAHKVVELLSRLWEWIVEKVDSLRQKLRREKARTEKRKGGNPIQTKVAVPKPTDEVPPHQRGKGTSDELRRKDELQRGSGEGDIEDLRKAAVGEAPVDEAISDHEEVVTRYIAEVNDTLESVEVAEDDLSDETLERLKDAREAYLKEGANSEAVRKAPIVSKARLPEGGERVIRLLANLGRYSILSETDHDDRGEVISHTQYRGPTPDEYRVPKPSQYTAATAKELLQVLDAYERLLDDLASTKKKVASKELRRYYESIESLQRVVKGKSQRGELSQSKVDALLTEVNNANKILSQLSLRQRTLHPHQVRTIREGLKVIEALRKNLSKD